jgi:hypothetical protein
MNTNEKESTILLSSSFLNIKPLLSSNSINEEYTTKVHQIISSWNKNELKPK